VSKFRKKPVVIEAMQIDGYDSIHRIIEWVNAANHQFDQSDSQTWTIASYYGEVRIRTLEGDMTAQKGDWIIKGVKGEFYPCKPDIFEATYEAADKPLLLEDGQEVFVRVALSMGNPHLLATMKCSL
jgi:hypothetical protein